LEPDESDDEWDDHIRRRFGEIAFAHRNPRREAGAGHVDVEEALQQTFGMCDDIREEVSDTYRDRTGCNMGVGDDDGYDCFDEEDIPWGNPEAMDVAAAAEYKTLTKEAHIPLFEGATMTSMEATTILLNILREGGALNLLISQVFVALHRAILLQPNTLPESKYEASHVLRRLGLSFQSIHACLNGSVLFRGMYAESMICPACGSMRMVKRGNTMVPQKVLRYFPLVPRLKRMFRSPLQAAAMTWHARLDS
jgi:hypothetical protein